ncbi:hypothetical protein [Bradyrhizobium sp. SZCCHNRI3043]|uniref:hypothetical protein n=1 Tax=Bradyrhizobium sp. SZCCHNRI3043 TaxID=3057292 RepID=UPI0028E866BD|nr:hypothetical protein [Bradyrhizobium sp. SZCCHNRI3043]
MKRIMVLVATVMLATTAALSHQDVILSLGTDGTIPGLPPDYQTTRLHLVFSNGNAGALQGLSFLSSGRETRIQPCLLQLVAKGSRRQMFLTGSWYHDETIVPHYVQVEFRDPPSPQQAPGQTGVSFLFNLRDSTLLGVTRQFQPIKLRDGCPDLP